MTGLRIGVDLGGTKIEAVALDADGAVRARERVATPAGDYAATLDVVAQVVAAVETAAGGAGTVGIGTPGSANARTGRIRNANSTCLNDRPFAADLAARLGRPVRIANDANCFALSEAVDGAAARADVVFGVIVGTGVGGGLVVHGRPVDGANGLAGEWGHTPFPPDPDVTREPCFCGRVGCIETVLSGPSLAREFARRHGGALDAREIGARAATSDAKCRAFLADYADRLAHALATVVLILDPDVIVLGGGVSNLPDLAPAVTARLAGHVRSGDLATRVVPARWGDSGGVRGAAWLWPPA